MQQTTERRPPERPGLIRRILLGELPSAPMEPTYDPAPEPGRPASRLPSPGRSYHQPGSNGAGSNGSNGSGRRQANGGSSIVDVRPITEPDLSMVYFRIEHIETGVRLIAETLKRACAEIMESVDHLRDENATRPTAEEIGWAMRQALEPMAVAVHQLTETVTRPIVLPEVRPAAEPVHHVPPPAPAEPAPEVVRHQHPSVPRSVLPAPTNGSRDGRARLPGFPGEDAAQRLQETVSTLAELAALEAEAGVAAPHAEIEESSIPDFSLPDLAMDEPGEALPVQPFEMEPVERQFGMSYSELWKENGSA